MAIKALLVLSSLLILSSSPITQALPEESCQEIVQYAYEHQANQLCRVANAIKDLGCLCGSNFEAVKELKVLDRISGFETCFQNGLTERERCSVPPLSVLAKKYSVPLTPGVVTLPGLGMVRLEALGDDSAFRVQAPSVQKQETSSQPKIQQIKPVLDLSALPLDMPFEVTLNEASQMAELRFSEDQSASGDLAFSIDVGLPQAFLEKGGDIQLDIEDSLDDLAITLDSDFDVDVTVSSEPQPSLEGFISNTQGSLQFEAASITQGQFSQGSLDLSVLPVNIDAQKFGRDDVTIEMDIEIDGNSQIHDAIITIKDEDSVYPLTGLEVGNLLTEISGWMGDQLPGYLMEKESSQVQGTLRGVSKLLLDVGEQIGEIMPTQELQNGQSLEIVAQESEAFRSASPKKHPCMMKSFARAANSIMASRQLDQKVEAKKQCSVCAFVNQHVAIFWGVVVLGTLYVTYTLLISFYRYLKPCPQEIVQQDDDLSKPLILYAADFVQQWEGKEGFEPYCGPLGTKSQAFQ